MTEGQAAPPTPEGAPKRIGKYRILRQIAQGGMAEIYLASATGIEGFEKLCVLKRILPLLAANQEFVQMFLDEARIAASLLHSNIAQVFDIGSDQGSYYFVMEFLRGKDLRHILQESFTRQSVVPYEHVVTVVTGVCSGLHYAHEMRGKDGKPLSLVHRDISPQNIFVTHDGNVKLCDFGIAKSAAQLTETRVGTLKGKIRYMSPEQCSSEPLDRRSDVFALSIVLWELLTLRRLFSGKSDFDIFKAIVEEPIPAPSRFRTDVPEGLEQIVMKGLAQEREERFQSAQELQLALEDWARDARVPASSVRLASFMTELFGPPAATMESFLERASESDPIALRIKSLNAREISDSEVKNPHHSGADLDADTTQHDAELKRTAPYMAAAEPQPDEGSLPSVPTRQPPLALIVGACALCAFAAGLLVRQRSHAAIASPPPAVAPIAAPAPVSALPAPPPLITSPPSPAPTPPGPAPSPAATPPPSAPVARPRSLVPRGAVKHPTPRGEAAKRDKRPAHDTRKLDDLLPP